MLTVRVDGFELRGWGFGDPRYKCDPVSTTYISTSGLTDPRVLRVHSELAQVLFAENSGLNLSSLPGQARMKYHRSPSEKPQTALRLYQASKELQRLNPKMKIISTAIGAVGSFNHGSVHVVLGI